MKESTVDKQERGVENCLLQVIYLRDFHLASYARMINICAIDIVLIRHITNFTHSLLWMDHFYARKFFKSHADFSSVKHKSSFPSYIAPSAMLFRQFYWLGPTISRGWAWHLVPVSKLRMTFSSIPSKKLPQDFVTTFLIEASAKVW